ncbi:MAG TPA: hypothetical protein VN962_22790 [Polyangia bacterium]|nr:hypothetical protein [Polyangia bacterium]
MSPARRVAGLAARGSFRIPAFTLFALAVSWPVLATAGMMNLFRDAQVLFAYERDAAWSVLRFGSLPLWDPFYCGGLYALGTPQSRFVSPTFLLSLLFGPARGEALTIFVMLIVGLEGTFRYARSRGAGSLGAMLAAPVFAVSGVFIASPFLGWTNFFGFQLVPWALVLLRRAWRGDAASAAGAALFLAWIVGFGGTYAAPMTAWLCLYELGAWLVSRRRVVGERSRALGAAAFVAALALGLSAVRLAPLLETLRLAPRVIAGRPGMSAGEALSVLVSPVAVKNGNLVWSKQMYVVGAAGLALSLIGFARRRAWSLIPVVVAAFCAALGYALGSGSPFALIKRLPVYEALRYPERYLILVALVLAVAAGHGLRLFEVMARRRRWARVALGLGAGALVVNAGFLLHDFQAVAVGRVLAPAPRVVARPFQQARGNRWLAAFYAPMGRGSLSCWDAYPVPMSPLLRGDLVQEEYLLDPGAGTVGRRAWSPNAIDLDVTLARPATLLVNQNHHTGWRSNVGQVEDHDGLLAVALPAGPHQVQLRFRPRSAIAGAVSSALALLLAVWSIRRRRWDRLLAITAGVPLVAFAIVYAAIPEPRAARPPLRAPSGEPVIAAGPPAGAIPVGATFGESIALDAVRAPAPASLVPGAPGALELDWRVIGPAPRDVQIVVSLRSGGAVVAELNHELLSAALRFSDAPPGATLRDVVPFVVPRAAGPLDLWVGLSDAPSGGPVPITATGQAARAGEMLRLSPQLSSAIETP